MGGNTSRVIAKKAIRPIKNINVEERARKVVDLHKTKPVAAPRHSSTKEKIEKQVAEHPEIKEEIDKQDASLIGRVNRLQVDMVEDMPKIMSEKRPLPQHRESLYSDPLLAFEEPRKIPKGKISFKQLRTILDQPNVDPKLHQAELVVREYQLDLQDTMNVLQYFENVHLDELKDKKSVTSINDVKWSYSVEEDETLTPKR